MPDSLARPADTVAGHTELRRTWTPEGTPEAEVVVVHGLGEHSGRYEAVGNQLAGAGFGVTAFDLIGFGATSGRRGDVEDWTLYLDQVDQHVTKAAADGRPVVLLGHSMGGLIALEYTLSGRPAPALVVLSAPALGGGKAWQRATAPLMARVLPTLSVPNAITGDQLSRDPAVGEAYFADPLVHTKTTTRLGAEIFAAGDRCRAALSELAVPTLVLHGGLDSLVPPQATAALGEHPMVERRLLPTLRHEVFNEPEGPEVVDEVIDWIRARLTSEG